MRSKKKRPGAVLVIAMVFMAIAAILLTTSLRQTLLSHRSTKLELSKPQIRFMIDAGIKKAINELQNNPMYDGEVWNLSKAFKNHKSAVVFIMIDRSAESDLVEITVRVRLTAASSKTELKHIPGIQQSQTLAYTPTQI